MNNKEIKHLYEIKFIILSILLIGFNSLSAQSFSKKNPYKIAFGSCLDQNKDKPIWNSVLEKNPNLWIWLGDNIYKDTLDMSEKKIAYDAQKSDVGYKRLSQKIKILGTWDDHDFGFNDVGNDYPFKNESKNLFLDFFDTPKNSEIRKHEGVYSSELITFDQLKIKLILLDTRTFRSPLKTGWFSLFGMKKYIENEDPKATLLGSDQWNWLEEQLGEKADLYILVSSIQVINDTHRYEKWGNFPNDRKKLLMLLEKYAPNKSIILSGDRHIAEIFEETLVSGNTITDITSSSMNVPIPKRAVEKEDSRRISKIYPKENFGLIEISKEKSEILLQISIEGLSEIAFSKIYHIRREENNQK